MQTRHEKLGLTGCLWHEFEQIAATVSERQRAGLPTRWSANSVKSFREMHIEQKLSSNGQTLRAQLLSLTCCCCCYCDDDYLHVMRMIELRRCASTKMARDSHTLSEFNFRKPEHSRQRQRRDFDFPTTNRHHVVNPACAMLRQEEDR